MNTFGGIVSGLWLVLLGHWSEVGLGFAMLPGLIFGAPVVYFERRGSRWGSLLFAFLSVAYTMFVITVWCSAILFMFARRADSVASMIALLLWSYGIAIAPLAFLAKKDIDNEYSMLSTIFAQIAYLLVITLAVTVGMTLPLAFIIIGAVMFGAAILQLRIASEQALAQEVPPA